MECPLFGQVASPAVGVTPQSSLPAPLWLAGVSPATLSSPLLAGCRCHCLHRAAKARCRGAHICTVGTTTCPVCRHPAAAGPHGLGFGRVSHMGQQSRRRTALHMGPSSSNPGNAHPSGHNSRILTFFPSHVPCQVSPQSSYKGTSGGLLHQLAVTPKATSVPAPHWGPKHTGPPHVLFFCHRGWD